jgi:hypothetical protein
MKSKTHMLTLLSNSKLPLLPPIQLSNLVRLDTKDALEPLGVTERGEEMDRARTLGLVEVREGVDVEVWGKKVGKGEGTRIS